VDPDPKHWWQSINQSISSVLIIFFAFIPKLSNIFFMKFKDSLFFKAFVCCRFMAKSKKAAKEING
jgi:hypothetical protein